MLQNGMAILSTTEIYIGIMMLMLAINIYVWNRIFSSKRSNQLKHFYQINDALRIVLLLEALIGYTSTKKWDSDTYYYYSWVFIVTLIVLIVFGAIQNTKQFFDL
jgi:magnesium-transporting ATPase (P-type)